MGNFILNKQKKVMSFNYPYYSRYWDSPTYRYSSYYDWRSDYALPLASRYSTAWDYPLASRYSSYVSPYSYSRYYDSYSPYSSYYPYSRYGYASAYARCSPYASAYRSYGYGSYLW